MADIFTDEAEDFAEDALFSDADQEPADISDAVPEIRDQSEVPVQSEQDAVEPEAGDSGDLSATSSEEADEGVETVPASDTVGQIDVQVLEFQKQQTEASIVALSEKISVVSDQTELVRRQLEVQKSQLAQQEREKTRTENLVQADAATRKQLDDINSAIDQLHKQIAVTEQQIRLNTYNNSTQNRSILSEKAPLEKAVAQLQEQIMPTHNRLNASFGRFCRPRFLE